MKRDEVLADAAFGSVALGMLYSSTLSNLPLYQIVAFAIGSAIVLTAFRHWVVEMPFSLAILTNLGLWALFLSGLPPTSYMLAVVFVLVVSFALTPSFKTLGRLQRALLEGEEAKDPSSDVAERVYKAARNSGGISSMANIFQEINRPELGKFVSLKDCGRTLKELVELGEAYKLSAEGNIYVFPGITALNDPLTRSIIELAAGTGTVTLEDLILRLKLTPEVAQNALNRLEQFGIAVSHVQDGARLYKVKGLAKHYAYTENTTKITSEERILA